MATDQKLLPAEQAVKDARTWLMFWSRRRAYMCDANEKLLDAWLSDNLKTLTQQNIEEAFTACLPQLAVLDLRQQESRATTTRKVEVNATVASDEPEDTSDAPDAAIPAEITFRVLQKMDKHEFKDALKKYGEPAVMARYNRREA